MNSSSTNLQMPLQIEAKSGKSAPAAASTTQGGSAGQQNEAAFAQALKLLQSLARDVMQTGPSEHAKSARPANSDPSKQGGDGKDLPLAAWMLSLVLPQHLAASKETPVQGTDTHALQGSGGGQTQQLGLQLSELMQLLEASGNGTKGGGELKSELAVLKHAASLGATTPAATPSSAPLSAALTAQSIASSPPTGAAGTSPSQPGGGATSPLLVTDPGFAKALGDRVAWLAGNNGNHSAQLQLNPSQLGPLQVHVKVHGHHTEVLFQAQHSGVRDTLEAALPRLREMLSQGGQQVSVNIQQHFAGSGQGQFGQGGHSQSWRGASAVSPLNSVGEESCEIGTPLSRWYGLQMGVIDTYV